MREITIYVADSYATIGGIIGFLLSLILLKFLNKDGKVKSEYDERQKHFYYKGFCYAGFIFLGFMFIYLALLTFGVNIPVMFDTVIWSGTIIALGFATIYLIVHDSFYGLNNNIRRYSIAFIIFFIIIVYEFFDALSTGWLVENGLIQFPIICLLFAIVFLIDFVLLLAKKRSSRDQD